MKFNTTRISSSLRPRLPLLLQFLFWLNLFAGVTCQSSTKSRSGGYDVSNVAVGSSKGTTSQVFPEDGNVQFADNDAPPPPYHPDSNHHLDDPYMQPPMEGTRTPNGLEILVAIFFFVAAAWLLVAVFYALLALLVLRLRARGQLNLTDENFGRFYLFGSRRFYFPCGCLLRRYVIAFGHDQSNRRGRSRSEDSRYMSRSERRSAIEEILFGSGKFTMSGANQSTEKVKQQKHQEELVDVEMGSPAISPAKHSQTSTISSDEGQTDSTLPVADSQQQHADYRDNHSHSSEELVCSICLGGYDADDNIFYSEVCDHVFHANCILDWLERRNNTDCPCCRQPLVSDEIVWEVVKGNRKLKEKKEKKARKAKKEGRGWRLASLDSEVATARSHPSGEREGNAMSHHDQPSHSQGTILTLPNAMEDASGLDTSIESSDEDQDHTANSPVSANPSLEHAILEPTPPCEGQNEVAPPTTATERRSDASSSSSDDETTLSTAERPPKTSAKQGSRTRGEDDNEKRDPPCEQHTASSPSI